MSKAQLSQSHLHNALSYDEYRLMHKDLVNQNRSSGPNQDEIHVNFTKLNHKRMERLEKTVALDPELLASLNQITKKQTWVVLTETWCGDAAQNIPIIDKMANHVSKINLKLLLRDDNPELIDAYLTNGARSIPKLIAIDYDFNELFVWGPRPKLAQQLLIQLKNGENKDKNYWMTEIQKWYNADNSASIQKEFFEILTQQQQ